MNSPGRLAALRSRDFRLLWTGQLVSLTGSQMQMVGVTWQLYQLTGSAFALGTLGLCRVIPTVLFALGGGVIADALDRRLLMLLAQTLMMLSSLGLALATLTHHAQPLIIYLAVAGTAAAAALDSPSRHGLIPLLVPRADLPNALSLHAMVFQMASIGGPAIGGLVLARFGVAPIYFCDVASFLAVIGALLALHHRAPPRTSARIDLGALVEGLRFMARSPLIWTTMTLDFVATFFAGALLLMPLYADRILHVGPRGLGLLYAAPPIGAALAAGVLALRPTIHHQGRAMLTAIGVYGAAIAGFGVSPWIALSLVLLAISGAADTVSMVVRQTLRQLLTPDDLRGRMTSVNMIFFVSGPQLGEFEAGVMAKIAGPRISVATGGLACVVAALVTALVMPSLRKFTVDDYRAKDPT